ncbi:hypothetical protein BC832DRAFT_548456 [Gaertneriomyces semiglobifer]|nr:hypothetical protein BC832DRAFT_548456 [Gaertneriomyces semiglobifer]
MQNEHTGKHLLAQRQALEQFLGLVEVFADADDYERLTVGSELINSLSSDFVLRYALIQRDVDIIDGLSGALHDLCHHIELGKLHYEARTVALVLTIFTRLVGVDVPSRGTAAAGAAPPYTSNRDAKIELFVRNATLLARHSRSPVVSVVRLLQAYCVSDDETNQKHPVHGDVQQLAICYLLVSLERAPDWTLQVLSSSRLSLEDLVATGLWTSTRKLIQCAREVNAELRRLWLKWMEAGQVLGTTMRSKVHLLAAHMLIFILRRRMPQVCVRRGKILEAEGLLRVCTDDIQKPDKFDKAGAQHWEQADWPIMMDLVLNSFRLWTSLNRPADVEQILNVISRELLRLLIRVRGTYTNSSVDVASAPQDSGNVLLYCSLPSTLQPVVFRMEAVLVAYFLDHADVVFATMTSVAHSVLLDSQRHEQPFLSSCTPLLEGIQSLSLPSRTAIDPVTVGEQHALLMFGFNVLGKYCVFVRHAAHDCIREPLWTKIVGFCTLTLQLGSIKSESPPGTEPRAVRWLLTALTSHAQILLKRIYKDPNNWALIPLLFDSRDEFDSSRLDNLKQQSEKQFTDPCASQTRALPGVIQRGLSPRGPLPITAGADTPSLTSKSAYESTILAILDETYDMISHFRVRRARRPCPPLRPASAMSLRKSIYSVSKHKSATIVMDKGPSLSEAVSVWDDSIGLFLDTDGNLMVLCIL